MFEKVKKYINICTKKGKLFHNNPLEKLPEILPVTLGEGIEIQPPNSLYICFSKGLRPIDCIGSKPWTDSL